MPFFPVGTCTQATTLEVVFSGNVVLLPSSKEKGTFLHSPCKGISSGY